MKSYYKLMVRSACFIMLLSAHTIGFGQTNPTPQVIPYQQDFSTLLHTSTSYPAGLQGWKVSSSISTAIVTTGPTADQALLASSTASSNAGGMHNYNGKIGFLGSGATNPGIVLAINTTGSSNITLKYDIMQVRNPYDGGSNTRINESVLQYRIGNTGAFTTITGVEYSSGTTTQTTSGVTTPLELANRSVVLPVACENVSEVQIRWINHDVTGGGSRPSFAIDNILVEQDNDGDGYGALTDCNDNNENINPGAAEICDGIDNNCDDNIDDVELTAPVISPSGIINLCKPDHVELSVASGYDSYQWYKNGNVLSGATNESYATNKPGYYSVLVTQGLCSVESDYQAVAVSLYPNNSINAPYGTDLCAGAIKLKVSYDATYTYQWYLDDAPIAATSYVYYPTATGNYYCIITSATGCSKTSNSATVINTCERLGENEASVFVYPNPNNGHFNLHMNVNQEINADAQVQIFNVVGEQVYNSKLNIINGILQAEISATNLDEGMYIVKIFANGNTYNSTIILNH